MTATLAWNAVASFYSGLSFDNTGLMSAQSPWSGSYSVLGTIWATAQTTQFTRPTSEEWRYAKAGSGAGMLQSGGSYVSYLGPQDWTLVIEKFSNVDRGVQAEDAQFCLGGTFAALTTGALNVWQSTFAVQPGEQSNWFIQQPGILPDPSSRCFTVHVAVDSMLTITTVSTGRKGSHPTPPPATPFPLPYSDTLDSCVPPSAGRYWSDISGATECVQSRDPGRGVVMQMQTHAKPISWEHDYRPHAVLGDMNWANINVTIDTMVPASVPGALTVLGVRCTLENQTDYNALMNEISFPGLWWAVNGTGAWAVYSSIQAVGNSSAGGAIAVGVGPAGLRPGNSMTLSLAVAGNTLTGSINGQQVMGASGINVAAYPYTGWVGVGTGDYGQPVQWDSVRVQSSQAETVSVHQ